MRSIHTIKSGNAAKKEYYTQDESLGKSAQKAYYGKAESQSQSEAMTQAIWFGADAERLNLRGHAQQTDFEQIFDGYIPGTQERIRGEKPRADHEENCIYDVVLTCKKSVSMHIHLAKEEELYQAYQECVQEVAELIEKDYAQARIQVNGDRRIVPTEGIVALMIPHHTSRDGDMNVHTHLAIANGTYCEDGKWRSLLDRGFSHAYYMGDYFSARLAAKVQELGYEIRETMTEEGHPSWELASYSDEQIKVFSKRSENVKVKELVAAGMSRDEALLKTRKAKHIDETLEEAQERWSEEAQENGIKVALPLGHAVQPKRRESAARVLESAIRHYSHCSNHFTRDEIREYAFKLNRTFTVAELDAAISAHPALIDYGKIRDVDELKGHFTTVQALEREIRSLKAWMHGQEKATPILDRAAATEALADVELKSGQRDAIIGVLASTNQHQMIHGLSGVGKTTALRQLKALTDSQSVDVMGFAPSIDAAQKLSKELGIETHTVQKLVKADFDLHPNQLLIIDEAGMVSAQMLDVILQKANAAGARILLVGDTGQNQAIEAGSPMRSLMVHGAEVHHIAEIIRQQNSVQKRAVELIASGNGMGALSLLNEHGYIHPIEDRGQRVSAIAAEYLSLSSAEQANTLIVAGTNAEKDAITAEIREGLNAQGRLGESITAIQLKDRALTPEESQEIAYYREGDYIRLSRPYRSVPLQKDTLYQVVGKAEGKLVVATPGGRLYRFDPKQCRDKQVFSSHDIEIAVGDSLRWTATHRDKKQINGETFQITAIEEQRALALTKEGIKLLDLSQPLPVNYTLTSTSYRAQGSDRPRVLVSATNDPTSNREPFYVSISRQIKELKVWTEDYAGLERRVAESSVQSNPLELIGGPDERQTIPARRDRGASEADLRSSEAVTLEPPTPAESDERTHHPGIEPDLIRPTDSPLEPEAEIGAGGSAEGIDSSDSGEYASVNADASESRGIEPDLESLADLLQQRFLDAALIEPLQALQEHLEQLLPLQHQTNDTLAHLIETAKVEILSVAIEQWQTVQAIENESQVLALAEDLQEWQRVKGLETDGLARLTDLVQKYRAEDAIQHALQRIQGVVNDWHQEAVSQPQAIRLSQGVTRPMKPAIFWQPEYPQDPPSGIEPQHWDEFKRSAIHPDLIELNAESLSGQAVYQRLLSDKLAQMGTGQYVTAPIARAMQRYEPVAKGGWWGKAGIDAQSLVDLQPGQQPTLSLWGCFKPDHPRIDAQKSERKGETVFIKYEHPAQTERHLYLPLIPDDLAERIYAKCGVVPTPEQKQSGYWSVIKAHTDIPITITEGFKKTLAATSQGDVTIGLSGVNGLYRAQDVEGNKLSDRQLHPEIEIFAQPGRVFRFAFDQDSNLSTILNVRRDMVRTIELLEDRGCICQVVKWDGQLGKGVDDLMVNQSPQAYTQAIETAESSEREKRIHYRTQYNAISRQVSKAGHLSEQAVDIGIYQRAIARGDRRDGERFLSQSDQARSLRDPAKIQQYIADVKVAAQTAQTVHPSTHALDLWVIEVQEQGKRHEKPVTVATVQDDLSETLAERDAQQVQHKPLEHLGDDHDNRQQLPDESRPAPEPDATNLGVIDIESIQERTNVGDNGELTELARVDQWPAHRDRGSDQAVVGTSRGQESNLASGRTVNRVDRTEPEISSVARTEARFITLNSGTTIDLQRIIDAVCILRAEQELAELAEPLSRFQKLCEAEAQLKQRIAEKEEALESLLAQWQSRQQAAHSMEWVDVVIAPQPNTDMTDRLEQLGDNHEPSHEQKSTPERSSVQPVIAALTLIESLQADTESDSQVPTISAWKMARDYLTQQQGLPDSLVDVLHQRGVLGADAQGQVTFLRAGDSQYFWFQLGMVAVDRIVFTQSEIMAMAIAGREQSALTQYVSIDDTDAIPTAALAAMGDGGSVVVAFNPDAAGEQMAWRVLQKFPQAKRLEPSVTGDETEQGRMARLLWVWYQIANQMGQPEADLNRIVEVAMAFHDPNAPIPVSAAVLAQIQQDVQTCAMMQSDREQIAQATLMWLKLLGIPQESGERIWTGQKYEFSGDLAAKTVTIKALPEKRVVLQMKDGKVLQMPLRLEDWQPLKNLPRYVQNLQQPQQVKPERGPRIG